MNKIELIQKLNLLGIKPNQYSLEGNMQLDAINLYENYSKWEVFYLDERGGKNDERVFYSEREACEYIYKIFVDAKNIEKKFKINT